MSEHRQQGAAHAAAAWVPSAEITRTLDEMRDFVRERIVPLETAFQGGSFYAVEPELERLRDEVRRRGWWAPQVPTEWGGMGLDLVTHGRVGEILGYSPLGHYVFGTHAPDAGNVEVLIDYGTPEQQERWLKPLAAGRIRSCFGMTEPEVAGSNPTRLLSTAELDGDTWVINAHKWFTTAADGAAFCIVMVNTEPESAGPHTRASMILVPTDSPGYELVRNISVMGEPGDGFASHAEIRLTNVRVPASNLIGGRGMGFAIAQARLGPGRIHHCMRWLGIAERAFELMCQRAATRELSPGRPLASRQTVQNWIAESRAEIDAARLLVLHTAARIEEVGSHSARNDISMIKFFVAGILQQVLDRAVQTHGALGMTDDTILAWLFRHERAARIYDGPDEVHKSVVARRVLQAYGGR